MKIKLLLRKSIVFLFLVAWLGFFSTSAMAQSSYIYKWLQPYDIENGIDIQSYIGRDGTGAPVIDHRLADDWLCVDDRPVTDIHWWGSYWEILDDGTLIPYTEEIDPYRNMGTSPQFWVQIYSDVPAGADGTPSHPGVLLWEKPTAFPGGFVGIEQNPDMVGAAKFGWNWILDEKDWFRQGSGENVYWLSIYQALRPEDRYLWGWETSSKFWNDDAVVWDGNRYVPIGADVGLAFGLTTVPIPGAVWLLTSGLIGLLGVRRQRRK